MPTDNSSRSLLTEYGNLMYARGLMKGLVDTDADWLMPLSNRLRMAVEQYLPTTSDWYKGQLEGEEDDPAG